MKDEDIREAIGSCIRQEISSHVQNEHSITVFDCPNCGHKTAATGVKLETGKAVTDYIWGPEIKHKETIPGEQCLTCGKKFTKVEPKEQWKEWVKPK